MAGRTVEELIALLKSEDAIERVFAAEELGKRGDPAAVGPLVKALSALACEDESDLPMAKASIRALAALGDTHAADAIVEVIEKARDDEVLPGIACEALAQLHAVWALQPLERLLQDRKHADHAKGLAGALVVLGGATEAPLFMELLGSWQENVKVAAATALGRLRHLPAVSALEKLSKSWNSEVKVAALGALVAMEATGAEAELRELLSVASGRPEKMRILRMIREQSLRAMAGFLFEKASGPRGLDTDEDLLLEMLGVAASVGSEPAVARLHAIHEGPTQSPCSRARAAAFLLDVGQADLLPACLDFLRRNGGHAEDDKRDPWSRCDDTQLEMVDVLERHASRRSEAFRPVVELLHAVRHEKHFNSKPVRERAGRAVRALTGVEVFPEFDAWLALRGG